MGINKAKAKDKILKFLITQPKGADNTTISKKLFFGKIGAVGVKKLIYEIVNHDKYLIDIEEKKDIILVKPNDVTENFVVNNSFLNYSLGEAFHNIKDASERKKIDSEEKELQKLQFENLQLNNELSKQKIKTHWIPIGISGFGVIVALVALVWSISSNSNNVTEEQLNPKIDSIQNKLEQLENGYKKERDSLREELLKADMLIRVLEDATPPTKSKI
ncbi:hypothetical protein QSE00_19310 [Arenibacter sp. M-2]|uniref:hypothetical protein n=1 Tax=Arenibacter sp. M-2 TaxID=3053612 RepID=UPI00256FB1E2|nr:hypothetical protein [Arenibacter sp. M-2]MDL5513974.1 hypothetical protein [Arenibacter sp. M-2]